MAKMIGHPDLVPYPYDIATPSKIVLAKLNGEDVALSCCVHAAYQGLGVVLNHLMPSDHSSDVLTPDGWSGPCIYSGDEKSKAVLEEASSFRGPLTDVLLQQLYTVFMSKLQEWLKK